ncbi:hypothetical protein COU37_02655 [Candidatus Micrarchaeota archaeon CG10_big_fil_rev_8_21_14_0_10_45_29]|nr:MAG: hypothetical protein COU37_02655 [Candidatus Micrarchaeota archaeon CG10_big_fil_rev_8_21_14_0_10_45_29]
MKINEIVAGAFLLLIIAWVGASSLVQNPAAQSCTGSACAINLAAGAANSNTLAYAGTAQASPSGSSGAGASSGETKTFTLSYSGGYYSPRTITVNEGDKVRIEFDQKKFTGCMTTFNIYNLGIKAYVPNTPFVEFVADKPGEYRTGCNMGMGDGKIVVNPKGAASTQGASSSPAQAQQSADGSLPPLPEGLGGSCGSGCGCGG